MTTWYADINRDDLIDADNVNYILDMNRKIIDRYEKKIEKLVSDNNLNIVRTYDTLCNKHIYFDEDLKIKIFEVSGFLPPVDMAVDTYKKVKRYIDEKKGESTMP